MNEREQLLRTILHLSKTCSNLHVLVASRKEVDIRQALKTNCETLIVGEQNCTDIKRFVTSEINNLWKEIRHIAEPTAEEFFGAVADKIVTQSEGAEPTEKMT